MVAEKVIATLTGSVCPVSETVTLGNRRGIVSGNKFDGVKTQELESGKTGESNEIGLDNFCEVVVSYRCKFCTYVANDRNSIKRHVDDVHSSANTQTVFDMTSTQAHIDGVEKDVCLPDNQAQNVLKTPLRISDRDEAYFCSACTIIFTTESSFISHNIAVHQETETQTDNTKPNEVAEVTIQSDNGDPEVKRKRVRKTKSTEEKQEAVAKKSRPTSDAEYMCKHCKTKFKSSSTVETHEKCHIYALEDGVPDSTAKKSKSYIKGFICCHCDNSDSEKFLTWGKCAMHLWKEHGLDCDLHGCSACSYKTPLLAHLKDHERLHSSEAKFTCSTCRKSFKQYKQLKTHEKYHKTKNTVVPPPSDSRWYTPKECPVCNRVLSDSKCLKKHISAVHNKMKPYVCHICGHTSARKAELQLHVRQHTGEKPYKCPQCPFTTGDHNCLRKHKRRHDDSKPYECPHCDYSAIQSHAFKKHVLAVHPGQEVVFVCPFCSLVSVNEKVFEAHCKDHEEGRISDELPNSVQSVPTKDISSDETSPNQLLSNDGETANSSPKFWLAEENSMEVFDTGGITIPAGETETKSNENATNGGGDTVPHTEALSRAEDMEKPACSPGEVFPVNTHSSDSNNATRVRLEESNVSSHFPAGCKSQLGDKPTISENNIISRVECTDEDRAPVETNSTAYKVPNLSISSNGTYSGIGESRAISIVTELLAESDCNTMNSYLAFDPMLGDSIDLPDILCNDHSNDGTLEKLLNMNVTGFS